MCESRTRTNLLIRRFTRCTATVKIKISRAYCLCFYDIPLWLHYSMHYLNKFRSCCYNCLKVMFGYPKFSRPSVTMMLLDLKLPSFNAIIQNECLTFDRRLLCVDNATVSAVLFVTRFYHFLPREA